jgi:hypothetical protein
VGWYAGVLGRGEKGLEPLLGGCIGGKVKGDKASVIATGR